MATTFRFKKDDPSVRGWLTEDEIAAVKAWQTNDGYYFEQHDGHPTGLPLYIRMDGSTVTSNLTKFDTKNKTKPEFVNKGLLSQGGSGVTKLSVTEIAALTKLITDEWATMTILAKRAWAVEKKPATLAPEKQATYACSTCATTFSEAFKGKKQEFTTKRHCPTCDSFQTFKFVN